MADSHALIRQAFQRFDVNGDGFITREELTKMLQALLGADSASGAEALVAAVDKAGDGRIDYQEFLTWVLDGGDAALPLGAKLSLDYRGLLPERFDVDVTKRYALDKLALAEGGYGKVYVAKDREFQHRLVAVKKVTKTGEVKYNEAFYTEIALMKELDHPNICKLFETFEQGHHIFFVMEYLEGGEVFNRILETGRISEAVAADIAKQVAAALRYAHDRKIAHRDIKPENVVFCSKDASNTQVKLIDWGLGVSFETQAMKTAVGSFTYAAPEVIIASKTKAYGPECDLWSLGVLAYVMLCGRPPFWGSTKDHLNKAVAEQYPITGAPWDIISADAKDFIKRLLRANPVNRMKVDEVVAHPWLSTTGEAMDAGISAAVLGNLRRFKDTSVFGALCVTSVARQLGHTRLTTIHQVFRDMDANGDGVLSLGEVNQGFERIFGADSAEYAEVMDTFRSLDLDASERIDYTEFCAAGLGQFTSCQDDAIWASFKAFDIDDSGRITRDEVQKVLADVDVRRAWTDGVCADVIRQVMESFDKDGDGSLNFEEFMAIMLEASSGHLSCAPPTPAAAPAEGGAGTGEAGSGAFLGGSLHFARHGLCSVYDFLLRVSKLPEAEAAGDGPASSSVDAPAP